MSRCHTFRLTPCLFLSPQFFIVPIFRNVTLKALTEIAGITTTGYDDMLIALFTQTMQQLEQVGR